MSQSCNGFLRTAGLALLALPLSGAATDFDAMSLEELLNVELTVASRKALSGRESPGIVTLLTREELRAAGARDLVDALRLVPGFSFGVDVQGVAGLGVRGFWAHEGKVALLVDGVEMNENLYATLQFGNHYPVELIEKIEIIRGPGSAVYGGTAELAVIQVTTRSAADLAGWEATAAWGQGSDGWMRRRGSLAAGGSGDASWTLQAAAGQGWRSREDYTDIHGTEAPLDGQSRLDPLFLNIGMEWKGLRLRALHDRFHTTQLDHYDSVTPTAHTTDFTTTALLADYRWSPRPGLTVTPFLRWRGQNPWYMETEAPFEKPVSRLTEGVVADWEPSDKLSVTAGLEVYQETTTDELFDPVDGMLFDPDQPGTPVDEVSYSDVAVYSQALWVNPLANVTVGARFEEHSQTGGSFVPRLALTRLFDRVHLKALASRAFRSPAVMNISLNPDIEPETATVLELEAGWQASESTFLTANVFDIVIEDPISYYYAEETDTEHYYNFEQTARRGLELEWRQVEVWGRLTARISVTRPVGDDVPFFQTGEDGWMLGLPRETASLQASFKLGPALQATPVLTWMGARKALTHLDGNGDPVVGELDPAALLGLNLVWRRPLGVDGLELGLALHDLLDEAPPLAQPYDGWHAPLPTGGREAVLTLRWGAAWK